VEVDEGFWGVRHRLDWVGGPRPIV